MSLTARKLQIFGQVTAALNASVTRTEAIEGAVDAALDGTGLSCGAMYVFNPALGVLEAQGARGFRLGIRPGIDRHPRRSRSMPSRALRASEPLLFKATAGPADAAGIESVTQRERNCIIPEGINSAAFARVGSAKAPSGVLALCAHGRTWKFDDDWLELMSMISSQLGVALERAREQELQHRRLIKQELLQEFTRRLYDVTIDEALPKALEFAQRGFDLSQVALSAPGEVPASGAGDLVQRVAAGGRDLADLHVSCDWEPSGWERSLTKAIGELIARRIRLDQEGRPSRRAVAQARTQVAREVHDGVAQRMYVIQLNLAAAAAGVKDSAPASQLVKRALHSSQIGLQESRAWVRRLRRPAPEILSLQEELRTVAGEFTADFGVPHEFEGADVECELDEGIHILVTCIAQELLHNVGKHARAAMVRIRAEATEDRLCLKILDDGAGVGVRAPVGFGLRGVMERAGAVGGEFTLRPAEGGGTLAELRVPLRVPRNTTMNWDGLPGADAPGDGV